jgi:transposase
MAKGRAVAITMDGAERAALTALIRKHGAPQSLAMRARIVLAAASGLTNKEIAAKLDVCAHTAGEWRNRFARAGMDGLYDEPRPGAPRQIGDDEIAATIRKTLETRPKGATQWSLRRMATAVGHAPSTIHRIWQEFGLQPHRSETFKLSSDPLFVERCATSSASTCRRPSAPSCSASMKRARFRHSIGPSLCYRCGRARSSGTLTTTPATGQQRWTGYSLQRFASGKWIPCRLIG